MQLSLFAFPAISVWMFENGRKRYVWMPLIPGAYVIGAAAAIAYLGVTLWYGGKRTARPVGSSL